MVITIVMYRGIVYNIFILRYNNVVIILMDYSKLKLVGTVIKLSDVIRVIHTYDVMYVIVTSYVRTVQL